MVAMKNCRLANKGFTLLELIVVMLLISLILAFSTVFFAGSLPSSRFKATARGMVASIKHARTLALSTGVRQTVTLDLDARKYGIDGQSMKTIPSGVNIKVIDDTSGEISRGHYQLLFHASGSVEGGNIVMWDDKRSGSISLDPVEGALIAR